MTTILFSILLFFVFSSFVFFILNKLFFRKILKFYKYSHISNMFFSFKVFIFAIFMIVLIFFLSSCFKVNWIICATWYVLSVLICLFGLRGVLPSQKNIYGIKLSENIFMKPEGPQNYIVNYKGKFLNIYAEKSNIRGEKIVCIENSSKDLRFYQPLNQKESLDVDEYAYIVKLMAQYFKSRGYDIEFVSK